MMGLPFWTWIVFYALVLLMLIADLKMFSRHGEHEVNVSQTLTMTAVWIGISLLFCAGIYFFYPGDFFKSVNLTGVVSTEISKFSSHIHNEISISSLPFSLFRYIIDETVSPSSTSS